ncbi:MAG: hypothetical protein KA501_12470 [Bacteroidia bacterium]|nr:hypothetical protein [Bacteroidia bacterium]
MKTLNQLTRLLPKLTNHFYVLLLLTLFSGSGGCGQNQETPEKAEEKKAVVSDSVGKLYAWANPLSVTKYLDHTWVTTTSSVDACPPAPDFWYCWGICHMTAPNNPAATALGNQEGNISLAKCIALANDTASNVDTHAGITGFYAFRGVCHQVANRVLYATGSATKPPLTVKNCKGYALSHFLYGTYGRGLTAEFKQRIIQCKGDPSYIEDDMVFEEMQLKNNFKENYRPQMLDSLSSIRNEMHRFMDGMEERVNSRQMTIVQYCNAVNNKLTEVFQKRLLRVLGGNAYTGMFGLSPNEPVIALDLEIAKQEDGKR